MFLTHPLLLLVALRCKHHSIPLHALINYPCHYLVGSTETCYETMIFSSQSRSFVFVISAVHPAGHHGDLNFDFDKRSCKCILCSNKLFHIQFTLFFLFMSSFPTLIPLILKRLTHILYFYSGTLFTSFIYSISISTPIFLPKTRNFLSVVVQIHDQSFFLVFWKHSLGLLSVIILSLIILLLSIIFPNFNFPCRRLSFLCIVWYLVMSVLHFLSDFFFSKKLCESFFLPSVLIVVPFCFFILPLTFLSPISPSDASLFNWLISRVFQIYSLFHSKSILFSFGCSVFCIIYLSNCPVSNNNKCKN